jgi:predicted small secreted protein
MKKMTAIICLLLIGAAFISSCSSSKGRGCPTTNPRYFKP